MPSLRLFAGQLFQHAMWPHRRGRVHTMWQWALFDCFTGKRVHKLSGWHVWSHAGSHRVCTVCGLPWQCVYVMQGFKQRRVHGVSQWILCCQLCHHRMHAVPMQ